MSTIIGKGSSIQLYALETAVEPSVLHGYVVVGDLLTVSLTKEFMLVLLLLLQMLNKRGVEGVSDDGTCGNEFML